jgi:hypothetical protein
MLVIVPYCVPEGSCMASTVAPITVSPFDATLPDRFEVVIWAFTMHPEQNKINTRSKPFFIMVIFNYINLNEFE